MDSENGIIISYSLMSIGLIASKIAKDREPIFFMSKIIRENRLTA